VTKPHHSWLKGVLLSAIRYHEAVRREGKKDYVPANLNLRKRLYEIISKEALSESDYKEIRRWTLGILEGPFHWGMVMSSVVTAADMFLTSNWENFASRSLIAEFGKSASYGRNAAK